MFVLDNVIDVNLNDVTMFNYQAFHFHRGDAEVKIASLIDFDYIQQ